MPNKTCKDLFYYHNIRVSGILLNSTCGEIVSINYPLNYTNNHRCRWMIKAPSEHYVNLTIKDFDVPSGPQTTTDCLFDHVTFIDGSNNNLIGRYCNSNRPPSYIVSSYNQLLIEFLHWFRVDGSRFFALLPSVQFPTANEVNRRTSHAAQCMSN